MTGRWLMRLIHLERDYYKWLDSPKMHFVGVPEAYVLPKCFAPACENPMVRIPNMDGYVCWIGHLWSGLDLHNAKRDGTQVMPIPYDSWEHV